MRGVGHSRASRGHSHCTATADTMKTAARADTEQWPNASASEIGAAVDRTGSAWFEWAWNSGLGAAFGRACLLCSRCCALPGASVVLACAVLDPSCQSVSVSDPGGVVLSFLTCSGFVCGGAVGG